MRNNCYTTVLTNDNMRIVSHFAQKKTNHQPAMMGLDFGLFLLHIGRSESPVYGKPEKWSVVKKKSLI